MIPTLAVVVILALAGYKGEEIVAAHKSLILR